MEDAEIRSTMEQLERVWRRLGPQERPAPPAPAPPPGRSALLAELIRASVRGAQRCRALARLTRGQASRELLARAAERSREARRLQEEYFLLTGDSLRVPREEPERTGLLRGLRAAWAEEAEFRKTLAELALQTPDGDGRALIADLAERSLARSRFFRALLRRSMRED